MHALVTGGGGFLGRYIVEALVARGDQVRSFGRGEYPELLALGVEVIRGDIRDAAAIAAACSGIDCVFHTAARPGIDLNWRLFDQVNRLGTMAVILGCRQASVRRLVYTSSPSVTFAGEDQCGIDETTQTGKATIDWLKSNRAYYSLTKLLAEQEALAANGESLRTCALRPHLIWGPRDSHLIPRLIERARSGRLRRVGDGTNLVDITYVENAAAAHLQAADALERVGASSPPAGKAYFISQGEPVNCWEWIDQVLALVDLPPVRKSMSEKMAWRVGGMCEAAYRLLRLNSEPPMTRFLAAQLSKSHWFDIGAARRDFGYEPRVSTEEGMRRLGEWLRQGELNRKR
jgi:nucleoside-diphosphate-sugar epimerase